MSENSWRNTWSKAQITALLLDQFQTMAARDTGVERDQLSTLAQAADLPHAVIVSGLRRVGKSTLLAQMARRLGQDKFYYLNFEDDRFLGFRPEDAAGLHQVLVEVFGPRQIFVVDEIQNVSGWEHFVRRFMDMGFKFYITGSNASLLSRELGHRLTGRYLPVELFPFSFGEFLRFRGQAAPDATRMNTVETAQLQRQLNDYARLGGMPEPLKYPALPLWRTLYDDLLYRDIATRYHLEAVKALKELAFYLMSNPASQISFNKLKGQLRLGSVNTVKNYIEYLENSWLIFVVNVYDYSVKRQQIAPKKVYAIDPGLLNAVGFAFSPSTGKLLENLVYLALRRQTREIYYYKSPAGYEVDFYLPETQQLIQVARELDQPATREREIRALADALPALGLDRGLILAEATAEPTRVAGAVIETRSLAEWLLAATS